MPILYIFVSLQRCSIVFTTTYNVYLCMKKNSLPRGIRNNNPANILSTGQRWLGLCEVQNDKRFCQFVDLKYGIRAFFVLARTYRNKYGIKTVRSFIERFAPASENDVESYVRYIIFRNWFHNDILSDDYDYVCLLYSIIRYENHLSDRDMRKLGMTFQSLDDIRKLFNINIC